MENTLKNTREIREHKKKEILWALVLIFLMYHSSYKYSLCYKLLNIQNIYTLPSMLI